MDPSLGSENNPRYQKLDKMALLSLCPLFSGLSPWELKSIGQLMRLVEYHKDEVIYREGEQADRFRVVISGRFEAFTVSQGKKKVLAYLRRGDYFGEMSLLTSEPHSATLCALSDSLVLELKKEDFERTIEHNATVSLEISRRLSSRLRGVETRSRLLLRSDVISIFSQQHRIGRTEFSINLAASLFQETRQKIILLDMSPSGTEISSKLHMAERVPITRFHNIENESAGVLNDLILKHPAGFDILNVAHEGEDSAGEKIIISLLNHLAIEYRFILIDLPSEMDEGVHRALSQSDSIYFVTDSNLNNITETKELIQDIEKDLSFPESKISIVISEVFLGMRTTHAVRRELFGSKMSYSLPATPELKEYEERHSAPFVVDDPLAEYSRVVRHIARRISNNLVGVAFGSGAALGLAHVGVLKVLERENIPIDIIAGSSIGALIGSLYAVGKTAAEVEKIALKINTQLGMIRLLDFNLFPVRGLLHGKLVVKHFSSYLGNKTFEEAKIPLKVTGANLSTRQAHIYDSGYIAEAVRGSIAIPAIFKPVFLNKQMIVDGGILSPLPIGALQQAGANKIIAVNVFPTSKDILERRLMREEEEEKEARTIRRKNFLFRSAHQLKKLCSKAFFPNVFDILMNTIQSMEAQISEIESEAADLVIRPVMANASWVEFFKPQPFIKKGEEETVKMLPKIKALVSQQNMA